jgi:hypothetical protein
MMTFWEWLGQDLQRLLREMRGDEGYQAFVDSQNRSFKVFLKQLIQARKFTDPDWCRRRRL